MILKLGGSEMACFINLEIFLKTIDFGKGQNAKNIKTIFVL